MASLEIPQIKTTFVPPEENSERAIDQQVTGDRYFLIKLTEPNKEDELELEECCGNCPLTEMYFNPVGVHALALCRAFHSAKKTKDSFALLTMKKNSSHTPEARKLVAETSCCGINPDDLLSPEIVEPDIVEALRKKADEGTE